MRALLRDPCECQAELGSISRNVEVRFVSLSLLGMGVANVSFFCCVDKRSIQTRVKTFIAM